MKSLFLAEPPTSRHNVCQLHVVNMLLLGQRSMECLSSYSSQMHVSMYLPSLPRILHIYHVLVDGVPLP
jgi:hypothetical protein